MTHQWHDTYRHNSTPAHHLDPRSKLFVGLAFVGFVLFSTHLSSAQAAGLVLILAVAALLSHIPLRLAAGRIGVILPFALLMMLSAIFSRLSLDRMIQIAAKSLFSIAAMTLVSLTTPFPDMLRALEQCRLPRLMVLFLSFLYRYIAVLGKETVRLERGWSARYFGRFWMKQWMRLGHVLAALLIRSYERAERIYAAMLARGFTGAPGYMRVLHFGPWDGVFVGTSLAVLCGLHWARF